MSKSTKQHQQVSDEYFAGESISASYAFPFPPSVVWAALLDGPTWTEWLAIDSVDWTSPKPFGVGTTRTIKLGKDVVEEVFFAWENERRMAFRFDKTSLPIKAAAEDYVLTETPEGCRLDFTFKVTAMFPLNLVVKNKIKSGFIKGVPKLDAYIRDNLEKFRA